jgi:DNA polymerase-3 subunit delta
MKLSFRQIDPFVKSPDPKARVILIYGPDNGLMKERSTAIGLKVTPDLNDPFNAVTLTGDLLAEDTARLSDEAKALSMMGGARLIKIENGGDKLTTTLKDYLEDPSDENLVIVEANELGPRSSLRQLCEKAKNAAAIPCYVDDERSVAQLIRDVLKENNFRIDPEASAVLAANIAGDRAKARNELEKLITYMGQNNTNITLEDVQASTGDIGVSSIETLIYAVAGSDPKNAAAAFDRLIKEGVAEIVILRSLQNHFKRLHATNSLIEAGQSTEEALKSLQPPLFFKVKDSFTAQLRKWKGPKLEMILQKLATLEADTKKTGTPVQTLCSQAILSISLMR